FYNDTLGWDETKLFIPPRKKSSSLPEVFSPDEVVRLIGAARGLKQRVFYPAESMAPRSIARSWNGSSPSARK
ncbi:MAG TPA: hypothetical protein VGK65_02695, partial [Candidatus Binatia bacterium]